MVESAFAWTPGAEHAAALRAVLAESPSSAPASDWYDLPGWLHKRYGAHVAAVVGYGSWYTDGLRKPASFPDAYLVVDDYRQVHAHRTHVWWNRVLPPNVYYVWSDGDGHRRLRGKYNVISQADLARECGTELRDVYNAGRLTKRVWIAWSRNAEVHRMLVERLFDAHRVLLPMALAFCPERVSVEACSLELLALSFRGEARLEGWDRVRALYDVHGDYYRRLHGLLLDAFAAAGGPLEPLGDGAYRRTDERVWARTRRASEAMLRRSRRRGYLRWPRIVLTEPNLFDLAVNEAERKAGVRIRVTPRLRRHPLLFGLPEFLRVLRARRARERIGLRDDR